MVGWCSVFSLFISTRYFCVFSSYYLPGIVYIFSLLCSLPPIIMNIINSRNPDTGAHTVASSLPPSPLRFVPLFLSREDFSQVFPLL